jgi:hypothetical protein
MRKRRLACHAKAHRCSARRRVLCFECYRARIDRPERVKLIATPFPRVLSAREVEHRRRMLAHFAEVSDSRALARFGPAC